MCPLPQWTDAEQRDRLFSTHWDDPALAGWSDALYTIAGYVLYTTNSTYLTWQVRRRMTYCRPFGIPYTAAGVVQIV